MAWWIGSTSSVHGSVVHRIDLRRWIKTVGWIFMRPKGVCPLLILVAEKRMSDRHEVVVLGSGRRIARGSAMSG
jgi:hypothetical protein